MICWLEGDGHQVLESLEYLKIIGYFRTLGGRLTSGGRLPHWHYPVTQPDKINLNSSAPSMPASSKLQLVDDAPQAARVFNSTFVKQSDGVEK